MTLIQQTPFDILFRNLFDRESHFDVLRDIKIPHPVDIYETKEGLAFEIACTGLTKEDVEIHIEGDLLRITYTKNKEQDPSRTYYHRGIAQRSFNLGYKVSPRFALPKAEATMKNGLLTLMIPFADEVKPKLLQIK